MRSKVLIPHAVRVFVTLLVFAQALSCDEEQSKTEAAPESLGDDGGEAASQEEIDRLRALGYVNVVEEHDPSQQLGVLLQSKESAADGLLYFTNSFGCSSELMRAGGEVVRRWSHEPCYRWANTVLLPNGDVVAIHRDPADLKSSDSVFQSWKLLRLNWEGRILWKRRLPVHHDIDILADGRIAALTYRHEIVSDIHKEIPVQDHLITILDSQGKFIEEASLTELLRTNPGVFTLQTVRPSTKYGQQEIDLLHSNAIEWMHSEELAARDSIYALSNVLVTLRHQDTVAIFDWEQKKLVWAWGQGDIFGPHDGTILENGNILIFDNGLGRRWSRVIEVDPLRGEIVWEYHAADRKSFYTGTRGASQRLVGGNTLITNSKRGRAFEVTPEGEVVWDFRNPTTDEEGNPSVIVRTRRLPGHGVPRPLFPCSDTSGPSS